MRYTQATWSHTKWVSRWLFPAHMPSVLVPAAPCTVRAVHRKAATTRSLAIWVAIWWPPYQRELSTYLGCQTPTGISVVHSVAHGVMWHSLGTLYSVHPGPVRVRQPQYCMQPLVRLQDGVAPRRIALGPGSINNVDGIHRGVGVGQGESCLNEGPLGAGA